MFSRTLRKKTWLIDAYTSIHSMCLPCVCLVQGGRALQGGSAIICRNMGLKYKFPGISGLSSITWYNPRKPGMVGRYVSSYSSQKRKMIYALIARC